MKQFFFLFVLLPILAVSLPARADAWADFQNFNDSYYMIDQAEKGEISCHIRSSSMDDLMDKVPAIGSALGDQIDSFSVTVRPDGTIRFVTPRTNMPFGTYDAAEAVTEMLADAVAETKEAVWDVLEDAMMPRRDQVRDLSISRKDGKTHISLSALNMNGDWVRLDVVSSGDTDMVTQTSDNETLVSENKFIMLDGKRIMSSQSMHSHRTDGVIDQVLKVKYQQVGKVWFPSRMVADAHVGPQRKPEHAEISLTDCTGR